MMQTKGVGLISTREFVKSKFPKEYDAWVDSLPESSKVLYKDVISASKWYPFKEGFIVPMQHVADYFFHKNLHEAANQLGCFSAEYALKGIYKVFLLVASPSYLLKSASRIFSAYYNPSEITVLENKPNYIILKITNFQDITVSFEYRLGAWCQRAIELTNQKEVKYQILKSKAKGEKHTEIKIEWS